MRHIVPAALRGSGFQHTFQRANGGKISNYFQTRVVPLSRKTARWVKGVHIPNLAFQPYFFQYPFSFLSTCYTLSTGRRVGKGKIKAANGEGHFVIFSVQNACGGFAAFFLPWGFGYEVSVANLITKTWQTEH